MRDVRELGRKVKAKYPQYADIDDAELGRRVRAKFAPGAAVIKLAEEFSDTDLSILTAQAAAGVTVLRCERIEDSDFYVVDYAKLDKLVGDIDMLQRAGLTLESAIRRALADLIWREQQKGDQHG